MTRQEVKQELRELTSLTILNRAGIDTTDEKGLKEKYEKAISKFEHIEQTIFIERVFNNKSYSRIAHELHYSDEGIRKKYNKIIDRLADMLNKPRTNYDKITASVESLAEFFVEESKQEDYKGEYSYWGCGEVGETYDKQEAIKSTIEWLQKECEE